MAAPVIRKKYPTDRVIALVGNPNVGKSTIFNALTGNRQHTGNWPGKTVAVSQGRFEYGGRGYILVDLPGTYSLRTQSEEEQIAVEFLRSGQADCTLILADATALERSLILALQTLELAGPAVLCVNLLDEAERKGIAVELGQLEQLLGVPVCGTAAATGRGLEALKELLAEPEMHRDKTPSADPAALARQVVRGREQPPDEKIDRILLGRVSGFALLTGLLLLVFWLTIVGANYPSAALEWVFSHLGDLLHRWTAHANPVLASLLIDGIYATAAQVVAVMLPPMAIFFPLFAVLEDWGYLPRAAFLLDHGFQRCGTCGKQALTMTMGLGCNAVGVMGCRIFQSPRERLLAIVTNCFMPCNGKFATALALIAGFFTGKAWLGALILTGFVVLGVGLTFLSCGLLNRTILKGESGGFVMELPQLRRPQLRQILRRSFVDKTLVVLVRAVVVSVPAGMLIWALYRLQLLGPLTAFLEPLGSALGMDGGALTAFLLSVPANELFYPLLCTAGGTGAWGWQNALCVLFLFLFHWPCSTTCLTIRRESGSWKWVLLSVFLPTLAGVLLALATRLLFL